MKKILKVILLLMFPLHAPTVWAASPEEARTKLEDLKIPYTNNHFVKMVRERNKEAVIIFIVAGMSANTADMRGETALIMAPKAGSKERDAGNANKSRGLG
jgi:hypothetical protein